MTELLREENREDLEVQQLWMEKLPPQEEGTEEEHAAAFEERRAAQVEKIASTRKWAVVQAGFWGLFSLIDSKNLFLLIVFGVLPFIDSFIKKHELKRLTRPEERMDHAFSKWLYGGRSTFPIVLVALLVVLFVLQWIFGFMHSAYSAGLVKSAVSEGESWRLLTHAALHGSVFHILFNGVALLVVTMEMMTLAGLPLTGIVYMVSVVAGGTLSYVCMPGQPTVGASGGILGLFGFVSVLILRQRQIIPSGFKRGLVKFWIVIALVGLLFRHMIDNWAHLGGALAGAAIAGLLVGCDPSGFPLRPGPVLRVAGVFAWVIVFGSMVLAAWRIIGWPRF